MSDPKTLSTGAELESQLEEKARPTTKRPYHTPKLEDYGSVSGLTQSGAGSYTFNDFITYYS